MVWSDNDRGTNCDHCSRDLMTGVPAGDRKQGGVTRRHWTHQVAVRCIYCIVTLLCIELLTPDTFTSKHHHRLKVVMVVVVW